ncbi:MAG: alpha-2-macroglobulin [Desulfococcaceae bacterium]
MFQKILILSVLFVIGIVAVRIIVCPASQADNNSAVREKANAQFKNGNYKDAFSLFEKLCLDPANDPRQTGNDLHMGVSCLASLNSVEEVDEFREKVVEIHQKNWRLLYAAAKSYTDFQHYGFLIAGKFTRGSHRGGGQYADVSERDRGRALQLMDAARVLMVKETEQNSTDKAELADFFLAYADMLLRNRGYNCAWQLQYLTDIKTLPDWQDNSYDCGQTRGAPVDAEGNPVYYYLPESWDSAKNDGERWRWLLRQAVNTNEGYTSTVKQRFADFLHSQFGVQTMMPVLSLRAPESAEDADKKEESGIYALHTLSEEETIAKLATGIRRFHLPDEFNFIRIYREIGNNQSLAQIFENRRQYAKAAEFWKLAGNPDKVKQITANWGAFEPLMTQPAGKGATVDYRFRNGSRVRFTAHPIKIETLLSDVKKYIKSNPRNIDGNKENPENIGYRIVHENEDRYLDQQTAQWSLDLKPRPGHFDKRITVTTPLQEPGAYLLTAEMEDGNISRIIIWIDNTAIVRKNLDNGILWYVADAITGEPVEKANVEFFGYRREWRNKLMGNDTEISDFAEYTDKNGQIIFNASGKGANQLDSNMIWMAIATHPDGRLAFTGFNHIWYAQHYDQEYNETKVFAITDRPVYRPGQSVKFKFWVRKAQYDQANSSDFAGSTFPVQLNNPQGEKIWEQNFKADEWGGISSEYALPEEAMLGVYQLYIPGYGGGSFRVEEYKKPEFEVTVQGPEEAVRLGDTVKAKITAKYYFGAPVTHAKVKYKILRYEQDTQWYPIGPWDWLYGSGYGWFGYDYLWYPGWQDWGCRRPVPWWWHRPSPPPELLMDNEIEIGADGTVEIPIDTRMAKDLHGDTDHRYEITAEVTDLSRRTIVGKGSVTAARKPFKVYAWTDRGYYRSGDTIQAGFSARTPEGKDVEGNALIRLYRISYENEKPAESEMQKWEIRTGENRDINLQMTAASAGQYRLSCTVTDSRNQKIEGAYLFTVRGDGFDGKDFRFNALELIPEKSEYTPGENVKLMINTDRADSTVLLFVRPANGVYLPPKIIRMKGKSLVEEIEVIKKDMPNFFVEALTVADGKVHTEAKEIAVPPEKRVINVEVLPSAERYKPGEKAEIKVKLTDYSGEPFRGSTVLSVYDKAVEYISGGSNVPEIKAFFWKWRRQHSPVTESSLDRIFSNLLKQNEIAMQSLGIFGHSVADEDGNEWRNGRKDKNQMMMKSARGLGQAMPAPSAPMLEAAADMAAPMSAAKEEKSREAEAPAEADAGQSNMQEAVVRTQFADTAFWSDSITTDEKGIANISFTMPENLSAWKIKTWAMGHGTAVGEGTAETVTAKNLMVRLQAPRFFVQKDEVVLSANVHNYLKSKKQIQAIIELDGPCLHLTDQKNRTVTVDSNGEMRVDWRVSVLQDGEAIVRMKALTDEESDAMEMRFPVYVHGMDKMVPFCGVIRPEQNNALIAMEVPQERRQEASRLEIRYSPTLAGAMVDSLPYLTDYPYGCTEQTLNRFVPTVVTLNVLNRLGLDLKKIQEKQSNLNAQEIGDDKERVAQWKRYKRNPVFDETEVMDMVKTGVQRLSNMQLSDGGWGWFSGWGEYSYPHTTAVVVHGLQIAQKNGAAVVPSVLQEGIQWLQNYEKEQVKLLVNGRREGKKKDPWKSAADNLDAFVYMVLADAGSENGEMREFLYSDRNSLSVYGKTMYGLALHVQGHKSKLDMIMQNISQYVVQDEENQTAYLNLGNEGYWWYWYGSEIEAHAYYLKLLSKTDPKSETASRMVKYLLNNRKHSTYWNSTRDTAVCIEAFADYLEATDEGKPDMTVEILVDGNLKKTVQITAENLFAFDNSLLITGDAVETGKHTVEIRRKGKGPLYFNAYLSYFTLEDYITKAGLEIKVNRQYYKLRKVDKSIKVAGSRGQALDQKVEKYERVPLENLALLKSGDLVEVELVMESKNDYEYIIFEDMKAAGFEPVEVRSGYTDNAMGAYTEFRDEKVAFFVRSLARGKHSMSYRLRAEIPGKFSALPTKACGMYAPELRANSDEMKLRIED